MLVFIFKKNLSVESIGFQTHILKEALYFKKYDDKILILNCISI